MKGVLGFLFFLLFLAGFALISLQGRELAPAEPAASDDPITTSAWRGLRLYGQTIASDIDVRLSFGGDGRLSGSTGCNRVSGRYERDGPGFRIASLRATQRSCDDAIMNVERNVFDALRDARRARLDGGELRLMNGDGEWLATFEAASEQASDAESGS